MGGIIHHHPISPLALVKIKPCHYVCEVSPELFSVTIIVFCFFCRVQHDSLYLESCCQPQQVLLTAGSKQQQCCQACCRHRGSLKSLLSRRKVASPKATTLAHSHTNDRYLSTPKRKERVKRQRVNLKEQRRRIRKIETDGEETDRGGGRGGRERERDSA